MKIKINIRESIVILILSIAFLHRINGNSVEWYYQYIISFPVILMALAKNITIRIESDIYDILSYAKLAIMPYILASSITIIIWLFQREMWVFLSRPISDLFQIIYTMIIGIALFILFRERTINVLIDSVILSYAYTLIMAIVNIGLSGFFVYMSNPFALTYSRYFEMHDLCLSSGLIMLALLFSYNIEHRFINLVLMFVVFFVGYKRIALIGFALVLLIGIFTKSMNEKSLRRIIIPILIGIFIFCYIYVYIIYAGYFFSIVTKYDIKLSGRQNLYRYFEGMYDFAINYIGKGFGFVGKMMTISIGRGRANYYHTGTLTSLHNDIMAIYIELGFIGSVIWFGYQLFYMPHIINNKYGARPLYVYFLLIMYAYITYATDNTLRYFVFQLVFFTTVLNEILKINHYEFS